MADPSPEDLLYQQHAAMIDDVVTTVIDRAALNDVPPGAILAGVFMAATRHIIQRMLVAPVVPTVRTVNTVAFPALNLAASALLPPPASRH